VLARATRASTGRDDHRRIIPMERVCLLARVRPDRLEEYRPRHLEVWPEMTDALRGAGWSNYTLFLTDDGLSRTRCAWRR
jgi:L-rhamnose mutarotase